MYCLCLNGQPFIMTFIGSIHLFKKGKINVQEQHRFLMSRRVYVKLRPLWCRDTSRRITGLCSALYCTVLSRSSTGSCSLDTSRCSSSPCGVDTSRPLHYTHVKVQLRPL